jgi:hypothetical protein
MTRDPGDVHVCALAIAGSADLLFTFDQRLSERAAATPRRRGPRPRSLSSRAMRGAAAGLREDRRSSGRSLEWRSAARGVGLRLRASQRPCLRRVPPAPARIVGLEASSPTSAVVPLIGGGHPLLTRRGATQDTHRAAGRDPALDIRRLPRRSKRRRLVSHLGGSTAPKGAGHDLGTRSILVLPSVARRSA